MNRDAVVGLTDTLIALFDPLVQAIEDIDSAEALLNDLGYQAPPGVQFLNDFSPLLGTFIDLVDQTDDLLRGDTEPDYLALFRSLIEAIRNIVGLIRDIGTTLQSNFPVDFLAATSIAEQFPRQLVDYLLVRMLERQYPVLYGSLLLAGIIDEGEVTTAATPFNTPYRKRVIRWEKLSDYLSNPMASIQEAYAWTTDAFDYNGLIHNAVLFGQNVGLFCCSANPKPGTLQALNRGTDVVTSDNAASLAILKFPLLPLSPAPIGLEVYPVLKPSKDSVAGLGLGLYFDPAGGLNYPITDVLSLAVKYNGTAPLDAGVVILPNQPLQLVNNIFGGSGPPVDLSTYIPEFTYATTGQKTLLFDTAIGAKLEFDSWALRARMLPTLSGACLETDLKGVTLTIGAGQGDGFLQEILPAQPMALDFDLTLGFSSQTGLYFGGSASLKVTLPVFIHIGPLSIQAVRVSLQPVNGKIPLALGADISLSIGPMGVIIENMGVAMILSLPPNRDGNAGPMQVDFAFQPPDGAGLSIDAAGLSGGGFLAHDESKHEYNGVLQLQFNNLALQAFGLITTQVAGKSGYSLLALIDADFPPVQLGWGFTLDGVGGLLAVNRAASTDALHAALKADTLSSILFPKNAISNAPQVLATLDALFPTAPGRFIFGPMALIGWGTPTVISAALAVVIELPEPLLIILIARLSVRLPSESAALVRLNMDALGVLDLCQDSLSLDAKLYDSKLLDFTLSGDMALRANWSSSSRREFLLAIGGFHPQFMPPAGFPSLQRITIDMPSGPVSKLRLAAYLALTSNTVQFGATLDVFIGVSGFGLAGHLGYDALLQLDPFHFDADISGSVALTAGVGDDLMSVGLDATLSGPAPWHIAGHFKVHIVFFDVHVSFSHSWGEDAPPLQIGPVQILPLLTAALADARSWGAALPAGTSTLVSLKDTGSQVVHPLASLEVHESVVPLGLTITHFGSATVAGATSFVIGDYQVNGRAVDHEAIQDDFAPAQFFDLSDEEKLARPSFERHDAGVRLKGTKLTTCGGPVSKTISYETFYVDQPGVLRTDPGTPAKGFTLGDLSSVLALGASGRAAIRRAGNRRYTAPGTPVKIAPPSFVITDRASLTLAGLGVPQGSTYSDAAAVLQAEVAEHPARRVALQIVSSHELVST